MPLPEPFLETIERGDQFLVCFPRSGSRWVRLWISDIICQARGVSPERIYDSQIAHERRHEKFPQNALGPGFIIPGGYINARSDLAPVSDLLRPTFKSHNLSQIVAAGDHRVVYLFRPFLNVIVSHYFFLKSSGDSVVDDLDLNQFAYSWVPLWGEHLKGAMKVKRTRPDKILLVEYKDKVPYSLDQLARVADFLGLVGSDEMQRDAFGRMLAFYERLNQITSHSYPRCQNGDVSPFFDDLAREKIEAHATPIYEEIVALSKQQ